MTQLPTDTQVAVPVLTADAAACPLHVLLADGDAASRDLRELQLRGLGLRVSVARTGFEALVKASCQVPDVIMLDESLADIDAGEMGRLLTTCPVTSHIPLVRLARGRRVPRRTLLTLGRAAV